MLVQGQFSSAKRGGLVADVSSGLILLKKKKEKEQRENILEIPRGQFMDVTCICWTPAWALSRQSGGEQSGKLLLSLRGDEREELVHIILGTSEEVLHRLIESTLCLKATCPESI